MKKKRIKYSNGSSVIKKNFYKRIGDMDVTGTGSFNIPNLTASAEGTIGRNIKGTKLTAGAYQDTTGKRGESFSLEKQLPNNSSIAIEKNRQGIMGRLFKNVKGMEVEFAAGQKDTQVGPYTIEDEKQATITLRKKIGNKT